MNRRQFLGASLCSAIASAVLPWDRFIEWFRSWFVKAKNTVQLRVRTTQNSFAAALKKRYPKKLFPEVIWMHPDDYDALCREMA